MDDEDLDAPWPAIFAAELWGILNRLNLTPADRDRTQYQFKLAFEEAIHRDGTLAVADRMQDVVRGATYRRPTGRPALTRAALTDVWGPRWVAYVDELFGK